MAKPIEMLLTLRTRVGRRNHYYM